MPILFVVGNKMDLVEERTVKTDEGEAVARDLRAIYFEVSAKSGRGIEELFVRVAEESVKKLNEDGGATGPPASAVTLKSDTSDQGKKKGCGC
jgi:GTPase SAR1 family protein